MMYCHNRWYKKGCGVIIDDIIDDTIDDTIDDILDDIVII